MLNPEKQAERGSKSFVDETNLVGCWGHINFAVNKVMRRL